MNCIVTLATADHFTHSINCCREVNKNIYMCCFGKINQHHLSFSLHPTCHRFYDRSRWIIQKSNKCLFAGSPHLTFLPGKTLSQKPLVIPPATSGWSTAVSTFQSAVACSGTHIAHHNNKFLNEDQTDVGVFGTAQLRNPYK